jgi:hypothetical protein
METEPITRVVFRRWPAREGGDVIALMPELPEHDGYVTSYMHIGQHGAASYPGVIRDTRPATETEYAPLLRELTQIGYRVQVCQRRSRRARA